MMPGSIIDLVNVPSEHPPASLMPPVVDEKEHAANLTSSDGAQSFHLDFSFSSAGTAVNSIEIMEDGKSIARKVENLSASVLKTPKISASGTLDDFSASERARAALSGFFSERASNERARRSRSLAIFLGGFSRLFFKFKITKNDSFF